MVLGGGIREEGRKHFNQRVFIGGEAGDT